MTPTLPLVAELTRRGHDVACISTPRWSSRIAETGSRFIPYKAWPDDLSGLQELRTCFQAAFQTALSLKERYDLLIYDSFFYPGKVLAERLRMPCIRQLFTPAWNEQSIKQGRGNLRSWVLSWRATLTYSAIDHLVMDRKAAREMGMAGKRLVSAILADVAPLNIVYVTGAFQPYREAFDDRFVFTIPGIENTRKPEIDIPFERLRGPIVYISLGSMISSKRFLMKCIRAFANKNMTVILSTGKVEPTDLGEIPPNIYAYTFVPQLDVLQHADLFFTHGGMNSINEAMYYGVPMLVIPVINDQPINALQAEALKIGKRIGRLAAARTIYQKAVEVLNDTSIKANAQAMRDEVRTDIGVSGVAGLIEEKVLNEHRWVS
jgi:MGT family glycosyltransferase